MGGIDLPPRGDFATLTDEDVAFFREVLEGSRAGDDKTSFSSSSSKVRVDAGSLATANEDWMKKYRGRSKVLLLPSTTGEVSRVLARCNARGLAVVPQGGNTGLVGGVPVHDEVVVNLRNMRSVVSVDRSAGVVVTEAGVVLEDLESAANARGLTVPLDLGAKGKCQIGGNVSTNAGGLRLVRYGSLRGTVLGLEVVLADGRVLDLLRTLRKDNTGYDLKQLFIGAEGTLGVITKIALVAPPRPIATNVAFAAAPSFDAAVAAMRLAKQSLGGALSAFEFLDRASLELVLRELTGTKDPLPHAKSPFYVVVEVAETEAGGGHAKNERKNQPELRLVLGKKTKQKRAALAKARRRLAAFANDAKRRGFVTAFVVGANAKHASALWNLRERISLALKRAGATYKYDLSLPTETMYDVVEALRARVLRAKRKEESDEKKTDSSAFFDYDTVSVMGYGHLGDGNLHLNVSSPGGYHAALLSLVEPFVYEWTAAAKGSVSAEHGVGAMKRDQLEYSKPSEAIEIMRGVKAMLDPKGILNPYKVLPARNTTPDHQPRARL
jgi:D-2-hydroxyglutarate dehydrogenase